MLQFSEMASDSSPASAPSVESVPLTTSGGLMENLPCSATSSTPTGSGSGDSLLSNMLAKLGGNPGGSVTFHSLLDGNLANTGNARGQTRQLDGNPVSGVLPDSLDGNPDLFDTLSGLESAGSGAVSRGPETVDGNPPGRASGRADEGVFDPSALEAKASAFLFAAPESVQTYIEKNFRRTLADPVRKAMTETLPRPRTDALFVPKVDDSVASWLGHLYPKQLDGKLCSLQTAVLQAAGPVSCLWTALEQDEGIKSGSLTVDELVPELKDVIQSTLDRPCECYTE